MKKIISNLITISVLLMSVPAFAISGEGTESNPYLISSASDIATIHNDLDGYYKLTADIDMSGIDFEPIGNEWEGTFTGTIDGDGHSIKNLNINLPDNKYVGFVGCLEGMVKNLNIAHVDAFGYRYVGAIVGYAGEDAVVDNCTASGNVSGECQIGTLIIGGIVGYNYYGTITECTNSGAVSGYNNAGGIAGDNYYGTVSNCTNIGTVTANNGSASVTGGIVGSNSSGSTINNCVNSGAVIGGNSSYIGTRTGGIVGWNDSIVTSSINSGAVTGGYNAGGIAGSNSSGSMISNCFNTGAVTGRSVFTGGIMGDGDITSNCKADCMVNGVETHYISERRITLSNCFVQSGESVMMPIELYEYDRELTWISSDNSVAMVNSKGVVTGVKIGSATITATTELGISTTAIITVTSTSSSISLNKSNITLQEGYTDRITATLTPSDAQDTIMWTSSNENVATVENGVVMAVSVGNATITAKTDSGRIAYCAVNVVIPTISVASVSLNKTQLIMTQTDTTQLVTNILPINATNKDLIWTSSNEDIATVSNTGVVTAIAPGSAIVTATANNGCYHECKVDVVSADGASFIAKSTKASAGDISECTVSVVKNYGIAAYKLSLDYDSEKLEAVEVVPNSDIPGSFRTNIDEENRSVLNVLWYSDDDYNDNADLFTVMFKVKDGVQDGIRIPISLSYTVGDVCNANHINQAFYINNTEIEISTPLSGDIYEDGELNVHDILLLSRYITGLEKLTSRQLRAANLIEDNVVDIKDTVKLAQLLVNMPKHKSRLMALNSEGPPTITVDSSECLPGEEVSIPVSISDNTGIAGFNFKLGYISDELEILSITPNTDVISDEFKCNLGSEGDNGLLVSWYSTDNIMTDGTLLTIKAKCKNGFLGDTEIKIISADNNFCDATPQDIVVNYVDGKISCSNFVIRNETVSDNLYSADLYFDDSFEEQSATAIIAFYDDKGRLVQLKSTNITVKPGKVDLSIDYDKKAYATYKLMIWDGMNSLKPITEVK